MLSPKLNSIHLMITASSFVTDMTVTSLLSLLTTLSKTISKSYFFLLIHRIFYNHLTLRSSVLLKEPSHLAFITSCKLVFHDWKRRNGWNTLPKQEKMLLQVSTSCLDGVVEVYFLRIIIVSCVKSPTRLSPLQHQNEPLRRASAETIPFLITSSPP